MEFAIAVFTLGAVLILIGLVGGDLSYRGLQVPKVGMLPRFTTTITGGVFLVVALSMWLLTEFGHEASGTAAAASAVGPGGGGLAVETTELAPTTPDSSPVTLRITDQLTRGVVAETITVRLDDEEVGTLECTADGPDDALELAVPPGSHQVSLAGRVWVTEEEPVDVLGSARLEASPGAQYAITISEDGTLGLARAG
jgi:hypothetical protein